MKFTQLLVLLLTGVCQGAVVEPDLQLRWIRQMGSASLDEGYSVSADDAGYIYLTGRTAGTLANSAPGSPDVFVAKFDRHGNELWSRQFGAGYDTGVAAAVDHAGNVYVTGTTSGSFGGPFAGVFDIFLMKLDRDGNEIWRRQKGSTTYDVSWDLAVDSAGNAYVGAYTLGTLEGLSAGINDAVVIKYDQNGNELWTEQFGSGGSDLIFGIETIASGGVYVSGYTMGNLGGTNQGSGDAFLAKLDGLGRRQWTRQFGTSGFDAAYSVTTDSQGNAYVAGRTEGALSSGYAGGADMFLTKYNASGLLLWTKLLGTSSLDFAWEVGLDDEGNIFVSGSTEGSLGGSNAGDADIFLAKFAPSGARLWTQQFGGRSFEEGRSLVVAGSDVYIAGTTESSLGGQNAGGADMFVMRLAAVPEPSSEILALSLLLGACVARSGRIALRRWFTR